MKTLIYLLFCFTILTNAQTTYYFSSSQGKDTNNGLTPETPKNSLAAMQSLFTSAKAGDKFLLKRGDTWTTGANVYADSYHGTVGLDLKYLDGNFSNYITLGAYGNGNDPVINLTGNLGAILKVEGANYLIIENLRLTSSGSPGNRPFRGISSLYTQGGGCHYIIIRNCEIDHLKEGIGLNDNQSNHFTVDNCNIHDNYCISPENSYTMGIFSNISPNFIVKNSYFARNGRITVEPDAGHDHDIYVQYIDSLIIENNIFDGSERPNSLKLHANNGIVRGNTFYGSEYASIVTGNYINYTMTNMVIEKNTFYNSFRGIDITPQSGITKALITGLIIKNNIFYNIESEGILVDGGMLLNNSLFANNTIYNALYSIRLYSPWSYGNLEIKNNIFYNSLYSNGYLINLNTGDLSNIVFSNNLYYSTTGKDIKVGSTDRTLAQFKSTYPTQEANAVYGNPLFINPSSDFRLQNNSPAISPAINKGVNLSQVSDDFDGNSRPFDGISDIGAYEYGGTTPPPVDPPPTSGSPSLNMKVFLEGPYNNGSMNTAINGLLPLSQPYNTAPWNYSSNESVSSIPSGVVDWILIELRNTTSGSSLVARKAAFLKSDGMVVDLDGSSPVKFDGLSSGNYYVVIRHRNHIDIMSSSAIELSDAPALYDFSISESQAYGSGPMVNLGNNVWGMFAGDGDKNGSINVIDYGSVGNNLFETGYKSGDFDMNGTISVIDYGKTNSNLFKVSQVPN